MARILSCFAEREKTYIGNAARMVQIIIDMAGLSFYKPPILLLCDWLQ